MAESEAEDSDSLDEAERETRDRRARRLNQLFRERDRATYDILKLALTRYSLANLIPSKRGDQATNVQVRHEHWKRAKRPPS
jgi:hypothetical protein